MKKLLNKLGLLSMGMAFSFIMFSCSASMDSLLDDLEKASNKGNEEQLNKITEKIAARADELTYEQAKRFYDIFDEYGGYFDWGIPIGLDKTLDKILSTEKENGLIEPLEAEEPVELADEDVVLSDENVDVLLDQLESLLNQFEGIDEDSDAYDEMENNILDLMEQIEKYDMTDAQEARYDRLDDRFDNH